MNTSLFSIPITLRAVTNHVSLEPRGAMLGLNLPPGINPQSPKRIEFAIGHEGKPHHDFQLTAYCDEGWARMLHAIYVNDGEDKPPSREVMMHLTFLPAAFRQLWEKNKDQRSDGRRQMLSVHIDIGLEELLPAWLDGSTAELLVQMALYTAAPTVQRLEQEGRVEQGIQRALGQLNVMARDHGAAYQDEEVEYMEKPPRQVQHDGTSKSPESIQALVDQLFPGESSELKGAVERLKAAGMKDGFKETLERTAAEGLWDTDARQIADMLDKEALEHISNVTEIARATLEGFGYSEGDDIVTVDDLVHLAGGLEGPVTPYAIVTAFVRFTLELRDYAQSEVEPDTAEVQRVVEATERSIEDVLTSEAERTVAAARHAGFEATLASITNEEKSE